MLKLLNSKTFDTRLEYKNNSIINVFKISLFLFIAVLISTRDLYLAADDYNYLNHFYNARIIESDNILLYFIEEPLWRLWTIFTTLFLNPENAFKFTLFLSSSLFLFSVSRVNDFLFFLVAMVFVFHPDFATQMYFNQMRQGFALSLFLFLAVYCRRPILGSILASLIHTSFIFPLAIIILVNKVKPIKYIILYSLVAIAVLYLSIGLLESFDLGRRTNTYEFEGKFLINYYIFIFVGYAPILMLIAFYGNKKGHGFWFKLSLSAFFVFVGFTLFYYAAGRIMYYLSVFMLLMILENYKSIGGKIALFYYLFFLIAQTLFLESTALYRWTLILGS